MYDPHEDFAELLGPYESDEALGFDEAFDEAARRRPAARRPVPRPGRGNPVPQKAPDGYATKAELQLTAKRLDDRIGTTFKGVQAIDARVRTAESELEKTRAVVRREVQERKAATDALKKSLDEQRQLAMLLPLLSTQETVTIGTQKGVVIDNGDALSKLLPVLLMSGGLGGSGTGTGGGGLFGGGSDGGIGTLAIVMALAGSK